MHLFRRYLPPETQVVLVSATLPHEVLEMTHKFMTDPVRILVKRDELTLEVRLLAAGLPHQLSPLLKTSAPNPDDANSLVKHGARICALWLPCSSQSALGTTVPRLMLLDAGQSLR